MRFTKIVAGALLASSALAAPIAEADLETRALIDLNTLLGKIGGIANTLGTATQGAVGAINQGVSQIGKSVGATAAVTAALNANLPGIANAVTTAANDIDNTLKTATTSLTADDLAKLQTQITNLQGSLKGITGTVQSAVNGLGGQTSGLVANTQTNLKSITSDVQKVVSSLTNYLNGVKNVGGGSVTSLVNTIKSTLNDLTSNLNGLLSGFGVNLPLLGNLKLPSFSFGGFHFRV